MTTLPDIAAISAALAQTSLAVSLLILLVLAIRRPFARRFGVAAAYALWALPLARLFMPPVPASWSLFGLLAPVQAAATEAAPAAQALIIREAGFSLESFGAAGLAAEPGWTARLPEAAPDWTGALALLLVIWMAGAIWVMARTWARQAAFARIVASDSGPAAPALLKLAREIAAETGLRRLPDIRLSLVPARPMVFGALSPVVLLPAWFTAEYSRDEQRHALTHEFTHLRRGDLWALQAAHLALALQWFNPLAHLALRAFRTDQEAACDADVLAARRATPQDYGRTLLKAARRDRPAANSLASASLTMGHPLKERLEMMQIPPATARSRRTGISLIAIGTAAALFATASGVSQPALAEDDETHREVFRAETMSDRTLSGDRSMILLGDPAGLMGGIAPPPPAPPGRADGTLPPIPPMPPIVLGKDFAMPEGCNTGMPPAVREERIEGGRRIIIERQEICVPDISEAVQDALAAREVEMTLWQESHGAAFEADMEAFGAEMKAFGEDMKAWSAAHEATFAAIRDVSDRLAAACNAADIASGPVIVSAPLAETGETLRAVCGEGSSRALRSGAAEWVASHPGLSDEEKDAFTKSRVHRVVIARTDRRTGTPD